MLLEGFVPLQCQPGIYICVMSDYMYMCIRLIHTCMELIINFTDSVTEVAGCIYVD